MKDKLCKCGHKKDYHRFDGTGDCVVAKRIKGCIYRCVCDKFQGENGK